MSCNSTVPSWCASGVGTMAAVVTRFNLTLKGRKEMFYLTMHSTHFIYEYMASDIWLRTILIAREETRCHHMDCSFRLAAKVLLYTDRIIHTTAFVTPVVEHWLEWEIAQWVHHEGSIRRAIAPWSNALTTELHLAPNSKSTNNTLFIIY